MKGSPTVPRRASGSASTTTVCFRSGFNPEARRWPARRRLVVEEVERIRSGQVTEDELRTSKASFIETFTRNFSSAASTASLFASDEYTGRDPDYLRQYRDRISAVTGDGRAASRP